MNRSRLTIIVLALLALVLGFVLIVRLAGPADATNDKIEFCHATGSTTNPYVLIETSTSAFYNSGHIDHEGDIYPAGSNRDQTWEAQGDLSILANGCVVPEGGAHRGADSDGDSDRDPDRGAHGHADRDSDHSH